MMDSFKYYLLSAEISGIKNIQKSIKLDFYKKTIDRNFNPDKYRVKGIFGENGYGKTAIITAFSIYRSIVINPDYLTDTGNQLFLAETINKVTNQFTITCEFAFANDKRIDVFSHCICLRHDTTAYRIAEESLSVRNGNDPKSEYSIVYLIRNGQIEEIVRGTDAEKWRKVTLNLLTRESMAAIFFEEPDMFDGSTASVYTYTLLEFASRLFVSLRNEDRHTLFLCINSVPDSKHNADDVIKRYSRINEKKVHRIIYPSYERVIKGMEKFLRLFKPDLKSVDIDRKEDGDFYSCDINLNYGNYVINREFESEGIKKLISIYDALRIASNGGIVFIDEFDSNINSIYLNALVEYMMIFGKGQLCFTSHNIDIMQTLKDNKYSIDFLNSNQEIIRWINNGNKSPVNTYKNGLIEGMPYNIFAADFVGVFGEE